MEPRKGVILYRVGAILLRHATWAVFFLIAVAILPDVALAQYRPGPIIMAAAQPDAQAAAPAWLTAQALAGIAALIAAIADGAAKVITVCRADTSAAVCPFAVGHVALCHGRSAPPNEAKP